MGHLMENLGAVFWVYFASGELHGQCRCDSQHVLGSDEPSDLLAATPSEAFCRPSVGRCRGSLTPDVRVNCKHGDLNFYPTLHLGFWCFCARVPSSGGLKVSIRLIA